MGSQPELSRSEWELVLELLRAEHLEMKSEIHHTDLPRLRHELTERLDTLDRLAGRVRAFLES